MSTKDRHILDIYQMSLDTGISEDDIRGSLDPSDIVLVTTNPDTELSTARQARNAYYNLLWFFKNKRTAHSGSEINTIETAVLKRWKVLSMDELVQARNKGEALAVFNEAHKDIRQAMVAVTRLARHYTSTAKEPA